MEGIFTQRHSCRNFDKDYVVDDETLNKLIGLINLSPSSFNSQSYHCYIVKNKEVRENICQHCFNQQSIVNCSVCLVFCADVERASKFNKDIAELLSTEDTVIASTTALYAVQALGLNGLWIGVADPVSVQKDLNTTMRPMSIICIGKALKNDEQSHKRKATEETFTFIN